MAAYGAMQPTPPTGRPPAPTQAQTRRRRRRSLDTMMTHEPGLRCCERMGIEVLEASAERVVARCRSRATPSRTGCCTAARRSCWPRPSARSARRLHAGPGGSRSASTSTPPTTAPRRSGSVTGVATPLHLGRTLASYEVVDHRRAGQAGLHLPDHLHDPRDGARRLSPAAATRPWTAWTRRRQPPIRCGAPRGGAGAQGPPPREHLVEAGAGLHAGEPAPQGAVGVTRRTTWEEKPSRAKKRLASRAWAGTQVATCSQPRASANPAAPRPGGRGPPRSGGTRARRTAGRRTRSGASMSPDRGLGGQHHEAGDVPPVRAR